ncbi:MAG TPA: hypothetical protein VE077_22555 [Candidatus Methylomirabilis sp.]|nr:hypothetical protein [Candidatus Methylomirabilis sp.]
MTDERVSGAKGIAVRLLEDVTDVSVCVELAARTQSHFRQPVLNHIADGVGFELSEGEGAYLAGAL